MNETALRFQDVLAQIGALGDDSDAEHLRALQELYGRTAMSLYLTTLEELERASERDGFLKSMGDFGELLRRTRGADERNPRAGATFLKTADAALEEECFVTLVITTFLVCKLAADRAAGDDAPGFHVQLADVADSIARSTATSLPRDGDAEFDLREFVDELQADDFVAHVFDAARLHAELHFGHEVFR